MPDICLHPIGQNPGTGRLVASTEGRKCRGAHGYLLSTYSLLITDSETTQGVEPPPTPRINLRSNWLQNSYHPSSGERGRWLINPLPSPPTPLSVDTITGHFVWLIYTFFQATPSRSIYSWLFPHCLDSPLWPFAVCLQYLLDLQIPCKYLTTACIHGAWIRRSFEKWEEMIHFSLMHLNRLIPVCCHTVTPT